MDFKILSITIVLLYNICLCPSDAAIAKRANVEDASSPMAIDFGYESQYASRDDGSINLLTGSSAYKTYFYSIDF
ncbi:MAG: hypothetical protein GX556_00690 [Fibrobacter sp.]|nr:hypothetical protein [Fibrobacter sp.]